MTKDDIIKLAREAGVLVDRASWIHAGAVLVDGRKSIDKQLKRFATLIAAHKAEVITAEAYRCGYEAGVVAERERAEERVTDLFADMKTPYLPDIIAAITRARGTT